MFLVSDQIWHISSSAQDWFNSIYHVIALEDGQYILGHLSLLHRHKIYTCMHSIVCMSEGMQSDCNIMMFRSKNLIIISDLYIMP